ncbi:sugar ABC transporter substrate-binding protein, partial [Pseudomonas syringae pv. tagetis]
WSRAVALSLSEVCLIAHQNVGISGNISQNVYLALGALQGLNSRNLKPADVPVTYIEGMPDAIQGAK